MLCMSRCRRYLHSLPNVALSLRELRQGFINSDVPISALLCNHGYCCLRVNRTLFKELYGLPRTSEEDASKVDILVSTLSIKHIE